MHEYFSLAQASPAVETFIKTVDQAEKMSDRWLFLALLLILMIFCYLVIKYLIKDREAARVEHATQLNSAYAQADTARKEHADTMKEMYGAQTKLSAELLVALQENNVLIERIEKILERMGTAKT